MLMLQLVLLMVTERAGLKLSISISNAAGRRPLTASHHQLATVASCSLPSPLLLASKYTGKQN